MFPSANVTPILHDVISETIEEHVGSDSLPNEQSNVQESAAVSQGNESTLKLRWYEKEIFAVPKTIIISGILMASLAIVIVILFPLLEIKYFQFIASSALQSYSSFQLPLPLTIFSNINNLYSLFRHAQLLALSFVLLFLVTYVTLSSIQLFWNIRSRLYSYGNT